MPKIRILPEQLANQIAAGEVIERPASVVKELLENSLDAGADRIEIEIDGGGTRAIRVIDNGDGMDEDDVLLCFERHGTSKLNTETDLSAITTLGFRGEAIPSIAAVAKMTIISRPRTSDLGTMVLANYGVIKTVQECGAKIGTSIAISNLFGNTPARRKFLRTVRTEVSHIDDTVKSAALARPDVFFALRIDGRETLRLDAGDDPRTRLAQLLNYHGDLLPVDSGGTGPDGIAVSGLLVPPEATTPVAERLRLLVNGRVIRDRLLVHAVSEGLRSFLLKGRAPAGFIAVTLPAAAVDVNVHPAKHEVRFQDGRTVHHLVSNAVRDAMLRNQQRLRRDMFQVPERLEPRVEPTPGPTPTKPAAKPAGTAKQPDVAAAVAGAPKLPWRPPATAEEQIELVLGTTHNTTQEAATGVPEPVQVEDLIVIGTYRDLYLFCRNRDSLVVIDQHAAHERLLFEDLRNQFTRGRLASQQLLFPVTTELTARQAEIVENNLATLEQMGFGLRDFGGTTWVIGAVPALAARLQPQQLLIDVLASFGDDRTTAGGSIIDTVLATMACKAAVKAGDHLSDREVRALLERMARAELFSHCPHGRPVVKTFRETDLKKWFSRT